jgi:hypothetical protein
MLDCNRAQHCVESALELDKEGVSDGLDFTPSVARKVWTKETTVSFQRLKGGRLVLLGERGVPYDVRVHYRSETAFSFC